MYAALAAAEVQAGCLSFVVLVVGLRGLLGAARPIWAHAVALWLVIGALALIPILDCSGGGTADRSA